MNAKTILGMMLVFAIVAMVGVSTVRAEDASQDDLEATVRKLVHEEMASRETEPDSEESPFEEATDLLSKVDIHGFISQGYMKSSRNNYFADTQDGNFEFNEVGINFSANLTEKLRLGTQLFAGDLGDMGNNDVILDWAYGDYRWQDWLGFRAGKMKMPHGLYNETRDVDMLRTSVFLPQGVYIEFAREAMVAIQGVGIYGEVPLDFMGSAGYQMQWGEIAIDEDGGIGKFLESTGILSVNEFDVDYSYAGALQWQTPLEGLRLGGSVITLRFDAASETSAAFETMTGVPTGTPADFSFDNFRIAVLSAEYTLGDLILAAEYAKFRADTQFGNFLTGRLNIEGYYAGASYRFTDWLETGVYYSIYYPDADDRDGKTLETTGQPDYNAWLKDLAMSVRFDLTDNWVFKVETHLMNGAAMLFPQDNPEGTHKDWCLFAAKMTYSF